MADALYGRRCRLIIQTPANEAGNFSSTLNTAVEINGGEDDPTRPGLRVQFKIVKTDSKEPNCSTITVTNLAPNTRARLQNKGNKVILEAGYAATGVTRIFYGDARSIDHVREGADWNTLMRVGDGERSYRNAVMSQSFSANARTSDVLLAVANASGLGLGNTETVASQLTAQFYHGYVAKGKVSQVLDKLIKSLGYTWSIQNNSIQILAPNTPASTTNAYELSQETGLIGSPEMGSPQSKNKGTAWLKFKALIFPIKPGDTVLLKSSRYNGRVLLKKVEYAGDTHGNEWYAEMWGLIVQGS